MILQIRQLLDGAISRSNRRPQSPRTIFLASKIGTLNADLSDINLLGERSELESFWRAHLDAWRRSDLNQREYCELHGLPLKRLGNWRTKLKHEKPASAGKLLYRRGSERP